MEHQWSVEDWDKQAAHDIKIHQLKLEGTKLELKLRQEDRLAARKHQQIMKELEAEIRGYEAKWGQILRVPVMIIKIPLYILLGIAFIVATAKGKEITQGDYWRLLH